ncbi:MAG: transglycosylase SLT domain-containing protein [Proteobacteria bacterium]|nr:transglycosylase SLT domain-containing protein [Pseudomonadota bacterium]
MVRYGLLVMLWLTLVGQAPCAQFMNSRYGAHEACAMNVALTEKTKGIPRHLLGAISKVESGRKDPATGKFVAWPWTLNVEGQGYVYPTKEAAIAAVRNFQRQGKRSIDVGCMQVNLLHHPNAFASLEEALDPRRNVAYASEFLMDLKNNHGSWNMAVAHYHSATKALHEPYRNRVYDVWNKEKRTPDARHSLLAERYDMGAPLRPRNAGAYILNVPAGSYAEPDHRRSVRVSRGERENAHDHLARYRARAKAALEQEPAAASAPAPRASAGPRVIRISSIKQSGSQNHNTLRAQARGVQRKLQAPSFING